MKSSFVLALVGVAFFSGACREPVSPSAPTSVSAMLREPTAAAGAQGAPAWSQAAVFLPFKGRLEGTQTVTPLGGGHVHCRGRDHHRRDGSIRCGDRTLHGPAAVRPGNGHDHRIVRWDHLGTRCGSPVRCEEIDSGHRRYCSRSFPAGHDPLAMSLSAAATRVAFGGLRLVPIGAAEPWVRSRAIDVLPRW